MIDLIVEESERTGRPVADLMAEMLATSLMSDDGDRGHVHWITFHQLLEGYLNASIR